MNRTARLVTGGAGALALCLAVGSAAAQLLDLPPRASVLPGGAEIARDLRALTLGAREERVFAEIVRGNIPSWLRKLEPTARVGHSIYVYDLRK